MNRESVMLGTFILIVALVLGVNSADIGVGENQGLKSDKVYQVYVEEKEVDDGGSIGLFGSRTYRLKLRDGVETYGMSVKKVMYDKVQKGDTVNVVKVNNKWQIKE